LTRLSATLRLARDPWIPDGDRRRALSWLAAGGYAAVVADPFVLSRFAAGDEDAVRTIYRAYGRLVFAVAYKVLGDRGLAEDATQQAFLQAWRAAASFEPSKELGPWLATIARRAAIDVIAGKPATRTVRSRTPIRPPRAWSACRRQWIGCMKRGRSARR
jgi:hypothetical protein